MADILVNYASSDREWAFWAGQELVRLGHSAHIHEWEISAGGNIAAWMEDRLHKADYVLIVVSRAYLAAPYSSWERRSAQWAAASERPNFVLPVLVEKCELPSLLAHLRHCELFDVPEEEARRRLAAFLAPASMPREQIQFPGSKPKPDVTFDPRDTAFPGALRSHSNIPIHVPRHFLDRDELLAEIKNLLAREPGRVAITATHGLRGVGKSTLAAAFAEYHRPDYRATWWIRAQTESSLRADLVALGVRLGWVAAAEQEDRAVAATLERLRQEGDGILLIFDNAIDVDQLRPYLPRSGGSQVLITSMVPSWRGTAMALELQSWSRKTGADYLIARTGWTFQRAAAEALSDLLGGLPLAHEIAAAHCDRLGTSFSAYSDRFLAVRTDMDLKSPEDETVLARSFALALDDARKLHSGIEELIAHAAYLPPEPIPLFLFSEGREELGEPLNSTLAGDGLDEAVGALRSFALVERELIVDERDPTISTDTIRLHRLVRLAAQSQCVGAARERVLRNLVEAVAAVYPVDVYRNSDTTSRARRLDALAMGLVQEDHLPNGIESSICYLLGRLAWYRHTSLADGTVARSLAERALAISSTVYGEYHLQTAGCFKSLAYLIWEQGDLAGARPLLENALAINEKAHGEDQEIALILVNLAVLLQAQGDLAGAQQRAERALVINERSFGSDHPETISNLVVLAKILRDEGNQAGARPLFERALAVSRKGLGSDHPYVAIVLNELGQLLQQEDELDAAQQHFEQALSIDENTFGPTHPRTASSYNNLGVLYRERGDLARAALLIERALSIRETALGLEHPAAAFSLSELARVRQAQGDFADATLLSERALAIFGKVLGPDHPTTRAVRDDVDYLAAAHDGNPDSRTARLAAIERLTLSERDDVTRDILFRIARTDPDDDIRSRVVAHVADFWPDERTRNLLVDIVGTDASSDVGTIACEHLSRLWWRHADVRGLIRSQAGNSTDEPIRRRLIDALEGAGAQVSRFWEQKLLGEPSADDEPEMLPGYPALKIVQFRLRDIGPVRDTGLVELDRDVNIFLGDNAAGKTTILRSLGLASIGQIAANEVEDNAVAYLRKGTENGRIEVLYELIPDPGAAIAELGHIAVGLEIASGSSRFASMRDAEMSLRHPAQPSRPLRNSADFLGALRSNSSSQFGFVTGYGAVRTFSDNRFSIQPEMLKPENEWVLSLYRSDAWLANPEVFARMMRGDTSNIEGAPPTGLSADVVKFLRTSLEHFFPEASAFFDEDDSDVQISGIRLRFGELSEGYRSLIALLGHMLRCSLKVGHWQRDPTRLDGITLIDEIDLHLHPTWQARAVSDFRKAFCSLQLIASTHSPLVLAALKRQHVLIVSREEDGATTVRRPDLNPQGLGVAGILTNIFDLGSTIDQPTLDKISRKILLHSRRENWSAQEKQEYEELTAHLAELGFGREFSDPYFEQFAMAMARRHKATLGRLSIEERQQLDEYADQLLSEIMSEEGG
jgi:tetratricopeptide (TPR) repeat protein